MLRQSTGNMYAWTTHTWNPLKGQCKFDCIYCYMKSLVKNPKPIRIVESELKTDLGNNNVIFVGSSTDMFHPDVPYKWIEEVLRHCNEFPDNKYLLQTKSPHRYWLFTHLITKKNYALCTTIETNRDISAISLAPPTHRRATQMSALSSAGYNTSVTLEPIIEFDLDIMVQWMKEINPLWINIGADSKGHNLDEPSWDKIEQFISELKKFTKVVIKNNLGRLKDK